MFGQLRENILTSLSLIKDNPEELKTKFASYIKVLKGSKALSSYHSLYEQVETAYFENADTAKEFLDECLMELNKIDPLHLCDFNALSECKNVALGSRTILLDELVFNKNLTIKEKFNYKVDLVKSLNKIVGDSVNDKNAFVGLNDKLNSDIISMNENQKEALNLFLENDQTKISKYYKTLVEGLIDVVDNLIFDGGDSVDEVKKIIETKRKLIGMKNETVSIRSVENLLELKASFSK